MAAVHLDRIDPIHRLHTPDGPMRNYFFDLLHAARTLSRARAFTAVCVVSLGLGMGVVIAILLLMRMVIATPPRVDDRRLVEFVVRPAGQLRAQTGSAILDTWP